MEIMFTNQQALLKTINKYIRFLGFDPFGNRRKEKYSRVFDEVMRHYKNLVFAIKRIECNGKFKSSVDEVCDDMGIEMNSENPDEHVTESESNNRVIKYRVKISY